MVQTQTISRPVTNHTQPLVLRLSAVTLVEGTALARLSGVSLDFFCHIWYQMFMPLWQPLDWGCGLDSK